MELSSEIDISDPQSDNTPTTVDHGFKKQVEESKAKIVEAKEIKEAPKRKRGRPRKGPEGGASAVSPAGTDVAPLGDLTAYIEAPLMFISKIPASKYEIPELALTQDEAKMCAESLNALANAFVPDLNKVDPKTAAIFNACATIGSVSFQKYMIYLDKRKVILPAEPTVQEVNAEAQKNSPIEAQSYFSRGQV